jgi:hypothetical protein
MHVCCCWCCWCRILELTMYKNISHGRTFQIVYTGIIPGKAHTSPLQLSLSTSCLYLEHHLGHYLLWLITVVVRSASIRLLGLRVWIPVGLWIFVCCVCCVLSREWPLRRADHSFRGVLPDLCVCVCVCLYNCTWFGNL